MVLLYVPVISFETTLVWDQTHCAWNGNSLRSKPVYHREVQTELQLHHHTLHRWF